MECHCQQLRLCSHTQRRPALPGVTQYDAFQAARRESRWLLLAEGVPSQGDKETAADSSDASTLTPQEADIDAPVAKPTIR